MNRRGPADDEQWPGGYFDPRATAPALIEMDRALADAGAVAGSRGPAEDYAADAPSLSPVWTPEVSSPKGPPPEAYGRIVRLPCSFGQSAVINAVWTPDEGTEEPWTITTQIMSGPMQAVGGDGSVTPASIVATIQWMIGGATFSKIVQIRNTVAQQFPVLARKVMIDLQVVNINNATTYVDVAVGIARGGMLTSIERLAPSWKFSELSGTAMEVAQGPGVLLGAIGIVGGAPTVGPYYPMFLDLAPGLALGALAGLFPFLVCTPISGAGQLFSMSDEFVAEFSFQKKLYFVWSTTPGHVTLPALALDYCLNLKIGS